MFTNSHQWIGNLRLGIVVKTEWMSESEPLGKTPNTSALACILIGSGSQKKYFNWVKTTSALWFACKPKISFDWTVPEKKKFRRLKALLWFFFVLYN